MTRSTPISSKIYLSCSIFQPLHKQDGGLEAQSPPGAGSRSEQWLPQLTEPPACARDHRSRTRAGPSLPWHSEGLRTATAAPARPQPCSVLLLDVGPGQVSCGDAQLAARSHHEAGSPLGVQGMHRLLALPQELPPERGDGRAKEKLGDLGSQ